MPLFALLLELPGFGCRRLDKLNRRAIADGVNLARTLGDASAFTLDWLMRAVDGQLDDEATIEEPSAGSRAVDANPSALAASHRPLYGVVGSYRASDGQRRRLVLGTADDDTPVLLDRGRQAIEQAIADGHPLMEQVIDKRGPQVRASTSRPGELLHQRGARRRPPRARACPASRPDQPRSRRRPEPPGARPSAISIVFGGP
jgi:hypothetical protein